MARPTRETPPVDDLPGEWRIPLPYLHPPLTFNRMKGKAWGWFEGDRRNLNKAGFYLAKSEKLPKPFPFPVTMELVYWPGNNSVHDADNLTPTLKYLVDGIRQAGCLTDDRGRHVRSSICTVIERADDPEDRGTARTLLVIRRAGEPPGVVR